MSDKRTGKKAKSVRAATAPKDAAPIVVSDLAKQTGNKNKQK